MILVVEKTKLPVFLLTNHMTYVIEGSVWMLTSCSAPWWMCCGFCGLYCTFFLVIHSVFYRDAFRV